MSGISKTLGIGIAAGLIIGPLIGVALKRIAHVPYLETRFAFVCLTLGLVIGAILGTLGASALKPRLEGMSPGRIRALIAVGIVVNIAETVIIIRRIIPRQSFSEKNDAHDSLIIERMALAHGVSF